MLPVGMSIDPGTNVLVGPLTAEPASDDLLAPRLLVVQGGETATAVMYAHWVGEASPHQPKYAIDVIWMAESRY